MAMMALLCLAAFWVLVLVLPAIKRDGYSAMSDPISLGANGRFGYLQAIAFAAFGTAPLAVAVAAQDPLDGTATTVGTILLVVWGLATYACAAFPLHDVPPRDSTGRIHLTAAVISFVAGLGSMAVLTAAFGSTDVPQVLSMVLAVFNGLLFVGMIVTPQSASWGGLMQRVFVAGQTAWLALVAFSLLP